MNDLWAIALAAAATLGAWLGRDVPWWLGAGAAVIGLVIRRPALLCVGVALLASALAVGAWAGTAPLRVAPFTGVVTLLDDPQEVSGAIRVTVRIDGHHVEAWARGGPGRRLTARQAGERVELAGQLGPVRAIARRRLAERHIAGQLQVSSVGDHDDGDIASRAANRVRRLLTEGASSLSPAERALFTGFVLGDDRQEPPDLIDDFQASGLSHLTAVSGENLAFLLVLAGPVLRRLTLVPRFGVTVGLIAWFALLTRFEPSVVRAAAMGGLAATAMVLGRPASTIRLLALAVAGMVLIDPLLVWSVGWWLSVGATFGIAVLASPLAARLPGPRTLAQVLAVTVAAQVGVAPVAITAFGGIPVASVPANLLAVPVAGPLMMWGLPAGVVAGLVPVLAPVLHVPTRLAVRWIALVARVGARAPLGELDGRAMIAVGVVVAAVVAARIASPGARGSTANRAGAGRRRAAWRRRRRRGDGGRGGAGGGEGGDGAARP
jgi:competence protein ComEC